MIRSMRSAVRLLAAVCCVAMSAAPVLNDACLIACREPATHAGASACHAARHHAPASALRSVSRCGHDHHATAALAAAARNMRPPQQTAPHAACQDGLKAPAFVVSLDRTARDSSPPVSWTRTSRLVLRIWPPHDLANKPRPYGHRRSTCGIDSSLEVS